MYTWFLSIKSLELFFVNLMIHFLHILLLHYKATMFFLCFRWARALDVGRALPKKNMFFFCPARALDCCRFPEKNSQFFSLMFFFSALPHQILYFFWSKTEKLNSGLKVWEDKMFPFAK